MQFITLLAAASTVFAASQSASSSASATASASVPTVTIAPATTETVTATYIPVPTTSNILVGSANRLAVSGLVAVVGALAL
ncbi:hypothetical protein HDU98_012109 [Podochytrium sp. JEL0797]|nr:hypothetical protein HDU98_012109 [Podochytrium sp. JEL0797]